ncbi:hypothetical protein DJ021_02310 [Phenylobacterium hankyongense]|uniref:DUF2188 domain-containing protein n=1 Tax=Phenylobacterium hankyongense TaxID=1813876 RepID=A0A328AWU5_9CAUL|nr:hypothetical protein [Phenylobacterium hankyongense]RAK58715.1 hypothetical protein DJ021_02310 [Phenylobacterium hankyongense]
MRYEVVESAGEWIVRHRGVEVARFERQGAALEEVARRLRGSPVEDESASLAMRFEPRRA